jgi:hypothetical protein
MASSLTPALKNVFTRVLNTSCKVFIFNESKIVVDGKCYVRIENDWSEFKASDESQFIGFISYEQYERDIEKKNHDIEKLKQENITLTQKKVKKRNDEKLIKQKEYVSKVMKLISQMKTLPPNEKIEKAAKNSVKWYDESSKRIELLHELYILSLSNKKKTKAELYAKLKVLSLYNLEYDRKFVKKEGEYSQFQKEMKEAICKEWSEVTKFLTKLNFFTKLFENLPPGSWTSCEIPTTYWTIIYREYWEEIINCAKNNSKFPYNQVFMIEGFSNLNINESINENEEDDDDPEEKDNEEEEDDTVIIIS